MLQFLHGTQASLLFFNFDLFYSTEIRVITCLLKFIAMFLQRDRLNNPTNVNKWTKWVPISLWRQRTDGLFRECRSYVVNLNSIFKNWLNHKLIFKFIQLFQHIQIWKMEFLEHSIEHLNFYKHFNVCKGLYKVSLHRDCSFDKNSLLEFEGMLL